MELEIMTGCGLLCVVEVPSVALLRPKKVIDIWRQLFKWQIRQSFTKLAMSCNLDLVGLAVTPEEISCGHGCASWVVLSIRIWPDAVLVVSPKL